MIQAGVTHIGTHSFQGCEALASLTLGSSVESIGRYAFSGCPALTFLTIPDSVRTIGEDAFRNCSSLTTLRLGSGLTEIGKGGFSWTALTAVTIPDNVTTLGINAFSGCEALASVIIGGGLTTVGERVFAGDYALSAIIFTSSAWTLTDIGSDAFSLGNVTHPVTCTVYSPGNMADGRLDPYRGSYTTFVYSAPTQWTSGDCTCTLYPGSGLFTVSGEGEMADYEGARDVPWYSYLSQIKEIKIESGVTYIGANSLQFTKAARIDIA